MDYKYSGLTRDGEKVTGIISAQDEKEAAKFLKTRQIREASIKKAVSFAFFGKVPVSDMSAFTRQFSAMIEASLPMDEALSILFEQAENRLLKNAVGIILKDVRAGMGLGDAFARHPRIFNTLYCHILKAGEAAGVLDTVLKRLADHLERMNKIRKKVHAALAYPIVVGAVAIFVIIALLVFVVPTFQSMFSEMGRELPLVTKIVIKISTVFKNYSPLLLILIPLLFLLYTRLQRQESFQLLMSGYKLKIPVLGKLIRKGDIARFARTLSTLLVSGVPLLDALKITRHTTGNLLIDKALDNAIKSVETGQPFHKPLMETPVFPLLVVRMIAVGEKTGNLSAMLSKVAEYYEEEVNTAVDGFMSILEPILIVSLGIIIGFVLISMYLPLFEMVTGIQ